MIAFWKSIVAYLKTAPTIVQVVAMVVLGVVGYFAVANGVLNQSTKHPSSSKSPGNDAKEKKVAQTADGTIDNSGTASTNTNAATVNIYSNAIGLAKPADYATDGRPDPDKPLTKNAEAEDQKSAAAWHEQHSEEDNPGWKYIERSPDRIKYVKYRYFLKSDGCLEIQRQEHSGDQITKYVTISLPTTKLHDLGTKSGKVDADRNQVAPLNLPVGSLAKEMGNLFPTEPTVVAASEGNMTQVQVPNGPQFCLNPHPGGYRWTWGQVNGCQQPQYRTFDDGCQHYQVFNVCAQVWEPQIFWTYCRAH